MKKPQNPMQRLGARLRESSTRQSAFSGVVAQAKGMKPKVPRRPMLGVRGVSGVRGGLFREDMVGRLMLIANNEKGPNYEVARKLNAILLAARDEQIFITTNSSQHQALVDLMNKLLTAQRSNRKISLTTLQERVLSGFNI